MNEQGLFDRCLKLCGQKMELTAEKWNVWNENATYCGLFVGGEMVTY